MTKTPTQDHLSEKERTIIIKVFLYLLLFVPVLYIAFIYFIAASMSLCGVSGCSGGGYGVSYDPGGTQMYALIGGAVTAVAPFVMFLVSKYNRRWLVATVVCLVLVPVLILLLIGAGLDGYPINHTVYK